MFDIARYNLIFAVVGFIVLLLVGVVFFLEKVRRRSIDYEEPIRAVQNVEAEAHPRNARPLRVPARRRRILRHDVPLEEGESNEDEDNVVETDGKVGAKKLKKLEERATRKLQREALEQERKEKKIREDNLEKQRKKEEARIEAEEAAKASEEQRKKEEKEKQEFEEYLKIKEAFVVEEEGEQAEDEQDVQSLLLEFIEYIKEKKVVVLEDLAYYFKIKAQDAIDRIKTLQEEGQLTGVIDDRGKFIYITKDEYEAVAKFIKQRGRVSISELAESINRLINLNPDNMLRQTYMHADVIVDL